MIAALYAVEATIRDQAMDEAATQTYRSRYALPAVDAFFAWLDEQRQCMGLLPSQPFTKALAYAAEREGALRVYIGCMIDTWRSETHSDGPSNCWALNTSIAVLAAH